MSLIAQPHASNLLATSIGSSLAAGGGYVDIVREGVLAGFVTYTRASSGTYYDSAGVLQTALTNIQRKTYDPITLALRGLMIEEARTNLVLNAATLVTQSVTVAAVAHTLSFHGTGTVTLSGVSTAGPLVGTGATNRVTLTFTPTAGSLTLTVTGTCTLAQLEAGALVTSYIPTTSAAVTRAADSGICADLSLLSYDQTKGTIYIEGVGPAGQTCDWVQLNNSTINEGVFLYSAAGINGISVYRDGGVSQATLSPALTVGTPWKFATAFAANDFASCVNGGAVSTDVSGTLGTPTRFVIGAACSAYASGIKVVTIKNLRYYPRRLTNAELQALTA